MYHTYGSDDDEDEDEGTDEDSSSVIISKRTRTRSTQKKCKCGSTEHYRITHHLCPLNKKKQTMPRVESDASVCSSSSSSSSTDTEEELAHVLCTCGSNSGTHNRSCRLNPRNCITHAFTK